MKKHTILLVSCVIVILLFVFLLLGCGDGQSPRDYKHTYSPPTNITPTKLPPTKMTIPKSTSETLTIFTILITGFMSIVILTTYRLRLYLRMVLKAKISNYGFSKRPILVFLRDQAKKQ